MIITVSGKPGSGKSTVAKRLAERLGFAHASAGDFMRQLAAERAMSVLELSRVAEADPGIDRAIDERSRRIASESQDYVIDARLAWYFIPESIKVFLDVDLEEAARRIYGDRRGSERENVDVASTLESTRARTESEAKRYREYYGIDYLDTSQYDLVIDTSQCSPDEVVDEVVRYLESRGLVPRSD